MALRFCLLPCANIDIFSQEAKKIYIYMITFTTSAQASFTTMQAPYLSYFTGLWPSGLMDVGQAKPVE
jgi:hypothetical protein